CRRARPGRPRRWTRSTRVAPASCRARTVAPAGDRSRWAVPPPRRMRRATRTRRAGRGRGDGSERERPAPALTRVLVGAARGHVPARPIGGQVALASRERTPAARGGVVGVGAALVPVHGHRVLHAGVVGWEVEAGRELRPRARDGRYRVEALVDGA